MNVFTCNSCNSDFDGEVEQKFHYKSEWHRYNLKRKIAGVPGVTEALFVARQAALAQEQSKLTETPMMYSCALCKKDYRSLKAHAQHLKSRTHTSRVSQLPDGTPSPGPKVRIPQPRPIPPPPSDSGDSDASSESEWVEVDEDDDLVNGDTEEVAPDVTDEDKDNDIDPSCCFICDAKHKSVENCMVHMHKKHGFFIPDVEYLKDPEGLLTYLGLKVIKDNRCLYCNDRCDSFNTLEAVRKHMLAKSHCKVRYGDGDEDEEAELEDFYDYSSSYIGTEGDKLVSADDSDNSVELGSAGSELVITRKTDEGTFIRTLGSRDFLRYYRQKPRPSPIRDIALAAALASRYKSMGLATVQSREQMVRMKVLKEMNRTGVEFMRSKMGMKSNVNRNLPKNCTY